MQFQVPQFIDVEDKIFGPLTFKQFIYLLGGAGGAFVVYKLIPSTFIAIIVAAPIVIFALALSFYKVNDRPFIVMLEAAFKYYMAHKLFLWKKIPQKSTKPGEILPQTDQTQIYNPNLVTGKLKDLSWSLDVHEKVGK